jgi:hypothetical protein
MAALYLYVSLIESTLARSLVCNSVYTPLVTYSIRKCNLICLEESGALSISSMKDCDGDTNNHSTLSDWVDPWSEDRELLKWKLAAGCRQLSSKSMISHINLWEFFTRSVGYPIDRLKSFIENKAFSEEPNKMRVSIRSFVNSKWWPQTCHTQVAL